jgi:hypothetical protein
VTTLCYKPSKSYAMSEEGADQGRDDKSALEKRVSSSVCPSQVSEMKALSRMKTLSNTHPRRLYNVEEFSDVHLLIPCHQKPIHVHAHRAILAAGSRKFNRKHEVAKMRHPTC